MVIKEASIKVTSVIEDLDSSGLAAGEAERTESKCVGYLHIYDGGVYLVTYAEKNGDSQVTTEIKYDGGTVTVKRYGSIESLMVFKEGYCDSSVYKISPYTFDAEVITKRIRAALDNDGGTIDLYYNMKIGGAERSARMKIWISTNSNQD
ncbi:MAG: DUF1934 domain-containing protein [Clostridia bacterium]|nr:DUF1934 domain-containing protein [Clostridia bacterium]